MGIRKKWRSAEKANHAQKHGTYFRSINMFDVVNGEAPRALTKVSAGVKRAAARLKIEREAQAARVADAPEPTQTRQQRRETARRLMKMPVTMKQSDWHKLKGLPAIKPRKRKGLAHA